MTSHESAGSGKRDAGASDGLIAKAEGIMGFKFGTQYKKFLKEKGTAVIDGDEIYGLKDSGAGHLSTITETMDLRKVVDNKNVPDNMAVIHAIGNGDYHFVDSKDGVHLWFHERDTLVSKKMKFEEFLEQL